MRLPPRTYRNVSAIEGPLLYLPGTLGAALGESVTISLEGEPDRSGQVIDAGADLTVIQVFEDTLGMPATSSTVTLTGSTVMAPVGRELLGRVMNGAGRPLDGLPAPTGSELRSIWGTPINPTARTPPSDIIETGISSIDGLNVLVRGQKLPIFAGPGLPTLDVAAHVVRNARTPKDEPFAVVFAGVGITARESRRFLDSVSEAEAMTRTVVYLNQAADPTIERMIAPRLALTTAEFLAFERDYHVLVVIADMTNYCEALREVAAVREEVPGRRGYPGYLYTDLAGIFERAGIIHGRQGSLTQLPVLTMPDDDMTHPIPDLTGYITEGQIVLSRELHRRGIWPPIDPLPSLSRLMNAGIGEGKTVREHRKWADQIFALYARGREARTMATIVGEGGLKDSDRIAMKFAQSFEDSFLQQGETRRSIKQTFDVGWRLLADVPLDELRRLDEAAIEVLSGYRDSETSDG